MVISRAALSISATTALAVIVLAQQAPGQPSPQLSEECSETPTRICLTRAAMNHFHGEGPIEFEPYTAELAVALFKAGQIDLMWETLRPLHELPRQMQYSGFFEAFVADAYFTLAGVLPPELAQEFLARAHDNVKRIRSDDARAVMLSFVAHAYAIAGDVAKARARLAEAVASIDNSGIPEFLGDPADVFRSEVLLAIIDQQLRSGSIDGAIATLEQLDADDIPPVVLAEIAARQMVRGETAEADRKFDEALTMQERRYGDIDIILMPLARAQAMIGDTELAVATATEIQRPEAQSAALVQIASERFETGDVVGARHALTVARDLADEIGDVFFRTGFLVGIAEAGLARIGNEQTDDILIQALELSLQLEDPGYRGAILLKRLAIAIASSGNFEAALSTAARISDADQRALTLLGISAHLPG
jgi:tetratricopeptide (TPR) repeat protein